MARIMKSWLITFFGLFTSILTAVLLSWIEVKYNISIYGFYLIKWVIPIPIGAIGAGFVAAIGYYLGAILLHTKPRKIMMLNILLVSVATYFLIQYLDYQHLIRELTTQNPTVVIEDLYKNYSFKEYLIDAITTQQISFRGRGGVAVGQWGYALAVLDIVGFALGGFIVYWLFASKVFCEGCGRYFSKESSSKRYLEDGDKLEKFLQNAQSLIEKKREQDLVALYQMEGGETKWDKSKQSIINQLVLHVCQGCGTRHFELSAKRLVGNEWKDIDGFSLKGFFSSKSSSTDIGIYEDTLS